MKIYVNETGVSYLKSLAGELLTGGETMKRLAANLKGAFDENKAGLGPHAVSISAVVEAVNKTLAQCEEETLALAENILGVANAFQSIIDNDPYGSGASGESECSGGRGIGGEAASISDTARLRINDYEDYFSGVCAQFDTSISAICSNSALSADEKPSASGSSKASCSKQKRIMIKSSAIL